VDAIAIGVGRQTLHFLPDRLLVFDGARVGAVPYAHLNVTCDPTRFIEDGTPPRDARVVDRTWRYVNKSGGPDRRFKGNKELPVCLYDGLAFSSASGLNELVQVSGAGLASDLPAAIERLASTIPGGESAG
jgi:hypothetical protein